jgi:hypothetical protein
LKKWLFRGLTRNLKLAMQNRRTALIQTRTEAFFSMRLANQQHELYAVARAAGYSQTESAKRAGYPKTSAPNAGHRLEKQEAIRRRVAELAAQEKAADSDIATRPWIVSNLVEIVRTGIHPDTRDLSNANRALEMLAKLGGYMVDRKESFSEVSLLSLSSEQLNGLLRKSLGRLAPGTPEKILSETTADVIEVSVERTPE